MKSNNIKERLKRVMEVQTTSYNTKRMNKFIMGELSKIEGCRTYKKNGNIYATRGKADVYPCVVAHTDTVHDIHDKFFVLEVEEDNTMIAVDGDMRRVGVGGDDKVGVFVALEIIKSRDNVKVAFFRDEEVGCLGSREADMGFFSNVSLVLQCDRQGYQDFVCNIYGDDLYSVEFSLAVEHILKRYDRVEADGGLTDVYQLASNGLEVCVANMSCGYYDPHSDNEYIKIDEVFLTLSLVEDIVDELGKGSWVIKQEDRYTYSRGYGNYHGFNETVSDEWGDLEDYEEYGSYERVERMRDKTINGHTCGKCLGTDSIIFDEFEEALFCLGCQDYVSESDVIPEGYSSVNDKLPF